MQTASNHGRIDIGIWKDNKSCYTGLTSERSAVGFVFGYRNPKLLYKQGGATEFAKALLKGKFRRRI
jgi:hypothetical protein